MKKILTKATVVLYVLVLIVSLYGCLPYDEFQTGYFDVSEYQEYIEYYRQNVKLIDEINEGPIFNAEDAVVKAKAICSNHFHNRTQGFINRETNVFYDRHEKCWLIVFLASPFDPEKPVLDCDLSMILHQDGTLLAMWT